METLLEQAKKIKHRPRKNKDINEETIDLTLAFLKNEISYTQLIGVTKKAAGGAIYSFLALNIREAFRQGKIVTK